MLACLKSCDFKGASEFILASDLDPVSVIGMFRNLASDFEMTENNLKFGYIDDLSIFILTKSRNILHVTRGLKRKKCVMF